MNNSHDIPSPCHQVCKLDHQDICIGCGRTIDEITRWTQMSDQEKLEVLDRLAHPIE